MSKIFAIGVFSQQKNFDRCMLSQKFFNPVKILREKKLIGAGCHEIFLNRKKLLKNFLRQVESLGRKNRIGKTCVKIFCLRYFFVENFSRYIFFHKKIFRIDRNLKFFHTLTFSFICSFVLLLAKSNI